jgi:hypothetical protein
MRRFLAGLFAFIFILGFAVNAIGWAILGTVSAPETYTSIIRQPAFADGAADLVRGQVSAQMGAQGGVGTFLSADDVNWVAQQLVTGPWLTAQMERWLETLSDWLESDAPEPTLTLSLTELKQEVPSVIETLLADKLRQLPVCEAGYVLRALEAILRGDAVPVCLPPGVDVEGLLASDALNLRGAVADYLASVPDELDALALLSPDGRLRVLSALDGIRRARQRAEDALTAIGAGILILFVLIGLLRSRPRRALLQWWGWTMLLGGALALSAFGLVHAGRAVIWTWVATSPNGALPAVLSQMAETAFMAILEPIWSRVLFTGSVAAAVGLFLILLSFALPRGNRRALSQPEN